MCPAIVLDDREQARRIGLRGQRFFVEAIAHWYQGGPKPTVDESLSGDEQAAILTKEKEEVVAYLSAEKITVNDAVTNIYGIAEDAYGTPEDCIHYVSRLFEAGADEILFIFQMGGIPHEAIMQTIRNIGEKVIPHFRERALAAE